jgi:hypothetical protein
MADTKEKKKLVGGRDELMDIVGFISNDQWPFKLEGYDDGVIELKYKLYDGCDLCLRSDGTWYYA